MTDVFRTIIIPASLAGLARALAAGLSPGGAGMFTSGLSATGSDPATHWISSGEIGERFAECITSASALHAACVEAGAAVTLEQCAALIGSAIVSDGVAEGPHELIARLGLKLAQPDVSAKP